MELKLQEFLEVATCPMEFVGGEALLGRSVKAISIDTRTLTEGAVYIALKGENHDGHNFVAAAFEKKALAVVVGRAFSEKNPDLADKGPVFEVEDTLLALQELGKFYRQKFNIPVLGLTGTNGKTTTKEMVAAVLAKAGPVCKTEGNLNNHIGAPLTLFTLEKRHDFAVIEMGTNHFGEIARLCEIAMPGYGLITNIGHGHTEFLQNREGVARAKLELFDYLQADGFVFLNLDEPMLADKAQNYEKTLTFGFRASADIHAQALAVDSAGFPGLEVDGVEIRLPLVGTHNLSNALAAVAVGKKFGIEIQDIKAALENISIPSKRMQLVKAGGLAILNDSYNANPESTLAALRTVASYPASGRKILVFGDMLELGEQAPEKHAEIGAAVPEFGISALFAFGPLAQNAVSACKKAGGAVLAQHFDNKNDLINALEDYVQPGDLVLVKGSRGMKMEEVVEALMKS